MHIKHISLLLTMVVLTGGMVVSAQVNFEPYPVSEYVEQTGPNTMTFLSYPKYYKNALDELTLVDTTLVPSKSAEWDYEVSTGIWTLYVRNDGTFQSRHKGDVFTYRFENLGIGRGNQFQAFDLGKADWTNMMVIGDTVRWNEVFPNVDVTVRYIHDILKVDVKVKEALMNQIRSQVRNGQLNANDYLTARFEIPEVFISSQAKQGGVERDLYAEPISVNQPLEFVKDNKVVHKLRPVESYVLDDAGERILDFENPIRSQQQWRLNRNAPGIAEMSAHLGDLANAPEGDVVIDPSSTFEGEGFYGGGDIYDAYIDQANPSTQYGTNTELKLSSDNSEEKRILFGVTHVDSELGSGVNIKEASIHLYVKSKPSSPDALNVRTYKMTKSWYMSSVTWNNDGFGGFWSGGDFTNDYSSRKKTLENQSDWVTFEATWAFKSFYMNNSTDIGDKGFLLKVDNSSSDTWTFHSTESSSTSKRPIFKVEFGFTDYGTHFPKTLSQMDDDELRIERHYASGYTINQTTQAMVDIWNYNDNHSTEIKAILNFHCGPIADDAGMKWWQMDEFAGYYPLLNESTVTPSHYGEFVYERLKNIVEPALQTYADPNAKLEDIVIAIEIGNEEDGGYNADGDRKWGSDETQAGKDFAKYYVEAYDELKDEWPMIDIMSGSIEDSRRLGDDYYYAKDFLISFIDEVKSQGNNTWDKFPDIIAIHGYSGKYPPEYHESDNKSYIQRLKHLYNLCNDKGIIPNFANTEYGFGASYEASCYNIFSATNATETSQAVYYMREMLMNATMSPHEGIGWMYDIVYHHVDRGIVQVGGECTNVDLGFFEPITVNSRDIRYAAREYLDETLSDSPNLNDDGNTIWHPLETDTDDDVYKDDDYAWCGWKVGSDKYAAIWRYLVIENHPYVHTFSEDSRDLIVEGIYTGYDLKLYKFDFTSNPPQLEHQQTITVQSSSEDKPEAGYSTISIPDVTENPTIIIFVP